MRYLAVQLGSDPSQVVNRGLNFLMLISRNQRRMRTLEHNVSACIQMPACEHLKVCAFAQHFSQLELGKFRSADVHSNSFVVHC